MTKEKGKSHPFADVLRESEEVVWIAPPADISTMTEIVRLIIVFDVGMVAFMLVMLGARGYLRGYDAQTLPFIAMGALLLALPIACLITFFIVRSKRSMQQIYAVTNERLLYRDKDGIREFSLDIISDIRVVPASGTIGTLIFNPIFHMWPGVEDAAGVKQIIEDTKTKRAQELPLHLT